jgi:uncharacterized cupin superfamily protein
MLPDFPFPYDEYDMPMNTRPLVTDRLIEVTASYRHEMDQKSAILAGDHRYYCQAEPNTEAMQWEAVTLLLPMLARHYPDHFVLEMAGQNLRWTNRLLGSDACLTLGDDDSIPPLDHLGVPIPARPCRVLDWLARQVQEDLTLSSGDAGRGTPLVAGSLCFGGSWSLDDKLGKPFLAIHHEVPQFEARIGRTADLAMQRLKVGRPIGRSNWSIATTDRLNMAPRLAYLALKNRRGITGANAGERCFLRLEWQTLSRLPETKGILFTIHTSIRPLVQVIDDPDRLRRLTSVVKGIPRPTREYKGMTGYYDALVDYLERRCREAAGQPATTAGRLWQDRDNSAKLSEAAPADAGPLGPTDEYPPSFAIPAAGRAGSFGAAPVPTNRDADGFEPFHFDPTHVLEGEPRARVQWIQRSALNEPWYQVGRLRIAPSTVRMVCDGFQTFLIEEGEVMVTVDDEAPRRFQVDEAILLPRDSVSVWQVIQPLRCFFTYAK